MPLLLRGGDACTGSEVLHAHTLRWNEEFTFSIGEPHAALLSIAVRIKSRLSD